MKIYDRIILSDISSSSWEHPADRAALTALKQVKGLNELIQRVFGVTSERSLKLLFLASSVRVSQNQFPRVKKAIDYVVETFDYPKTPDVFVSQSPFFNAGAYGAKDPFIVINSSLLQILNEEELICLIGHEMGHIMSGHVLYKTLLWLVLNISSSLIPMGNLVLTPILYSLKEWDRNSELSADRAGLLAGQNEEASLSLLMKMAGGSQTSEMNINEIYGQIEDFEARKDALDNLFKLLNVLKETHPFPITRIKEVNVWAKSGEYEKILNGNYKKRGFEDDNIFKDINDARKHYEKVLDPDGFMKNPLGSITDGIGKALNDFFN